MSLATLAPMNAEDRARRTLCVALGCIACLIRRPAMRICGGWVEYHHLIVAGERAGHRFGVPLGPWHHQGTLIYSMGRDAMRDMFGPSLRLHGVAFKREFGTDQELLDRVDDLIGAPRIVLATRRRSRGSAASPSKIAPRGGFPWT